MKGRERRGAGEESVSYLRIWGTASLGFLLPSDSRWRRRSAGLMSKKRKSDATRLDEADRTMYSTFRGAANSLSQLYTQAMSHQKAYFQAGERHAMEKLYHWIRRQHEEGSRVTTAEIVAHLQNEIDYGGDDASMSPRMQFPSQHPPASAHFAVRFASRASHSDQAKNSVFSNALSSPVRRSLQPYHLAAEGGGYYSNEASVNGNRSRGHGRSSPCHGRDPGSPSSSMDVNSDGPAHGS